jgi:uncharacterized protein (TIGR01777 family)
MHPPHELDPCRGSPYCLAEAARYVLRPVAQRGAEREGRLSALRILISGSTGLIGSALAANLREQGHQVAGLLRPATRVRPPGATSSGQTQTVSWDPEAGTLDPTADGADAVVHLAGASIAEGRWTTARKSVLRDSRIAATHNLIDSLKKLARPPQVFVGASAIGIYGDRGDEELTEASPPGTDFLADLTRQWEAASLRASEFGARAVVLRTGIVLDKSGGALPRMALPFRVGAGGRLGSGRQWMSWLTLEELVGMIQFALAANSLTGPANAVSPNPVRNADFTKVLARALRRPAIFPAPGFALRLALGEMADALLLSSQRVLPKKFESLGYRFVSADLESALRLVLTANSAKAV